MHRYDNNNAHSYAENGTSRELVLVADNGLSPSYEYEKQVDIPMRASYVHSFYIKEFCVSGVQTPSDSTHFTLVIDDVTNMTNTTVSNVNSLTDKFVITVMPGSSNAQVVWCQPQLVMQGKGVGLERLRIKLSSGDRCLWQKAVIKLEISYTDKDRLNNTELMKRGVYALDMI